MSVILKDSIGMTIFAFRINRSPVFLAMSAVWVEERNTRGLNTLTNKSFTSIILTCVGRCRRCSSDWDTGTRYSTINRAPSQRSVSRQIEDFLIHGEALPEWQTQLRKEPDLVFVLQVQLNRALGKHYVDVDFA